MDSLSITSPSITPYKDYFKLEQNVIHSLNSDVSKDICNPFPKEKRLVPYPKDEYTVDSCTNEMPPPTLSFVGKSHPTQFLTRQVLYEYLHDVSLEALITLQKQCTFCLRKFSLIQKGDKNFCLVHGLICFQTLLIPQGKFSCQWQ